MLNNVSFFLALRYLQPKRSFVSIITLISVLGIIVGVAVLIIVISVMKGFEIDFKKLLIGFEPHVVMMQDADSGLPRAEGDPQPSKWQDVRAKVEKLPEVASATPFVSGMAFLKTENHPLTPIEIYGMPENHAESLVEKLSKHIAKTDPPDSQPLGNLNMDGDNIVLGDELCRKLGIAVGDKVSVYGSVGLQRKAEWELEKRKAEAEGKPAPKEPDGEQINERPLTVVGVLRTEATWGRCYMPLDVAEELFELHGRVHGIAVDLKDAYSAPQFQKKLEDLKEQGGLPLDWEFTTWMQRHFQRLAAIEDERFMMWFIMSFVIVVAAFSVMNTTITVTVQKRREIGILTALGARVGQIVGVFMSQAMIVAVSGTVLGLIVALSVLALRNVIRDVMGRWLGHQVFDPKIYGLESLPAFTQPSDVALICGLSVVLCLLGAFVPAYFAAKVDPAVALRD